MVRLSSSIKVAMFFSSYFGSWLPRMHEQHDICPSKQLEGGGQCYSRQFGSNISCPGRRLSAYRQRTSKHTQQREEASARFFGGCSRQSPKHLRPKSRSGNAKSQGKKDSEGRLMEC